jgi:hypothetical protein
MREAITPMGIAALAVLALIATSKASFAQAGSTGGTIGKQDKSISGDGEAPTTSPRDRKNPPARPVKPNQGTHSACEAANIEGNWNSQGLSETIQRAGCDFLAKIPSSLFNHTVKGHYLGSSNYSIAIARSNQITGCTTMMFGSMTLTSGAQFKTVITSTDGKCDLPANFTETRMWTR